VEEELQTFEAEFDAYAKDHPEFATKEFMEFMKKRNESN
jgi:hypothetical protein